MSTSNDIAVCDRFARLRTLIGTVSLTALARARVAVVGLGGVGSHCALALARSGIGSFVLVDSDCVDVTNINRQALAFDSTVGKSKVSVCADMILDINPSVEVERLEWRLLSDNLCDFFAVCEKRFGGVDFVVDACDTVSTKLALLEASQGAPWGLVCCMGTAGKIHPELLQIDDIYETHGDGLCRVMRKEARKRGVSSCAVVYSPEPIMRSQCGGAAHTTSPHGTQVDSKALGETRDVEERGAHVEVPDQDIKTAGRVAFLAPGSEVSVGTKGRDDVSLPRRGILGSSAFVPPAAGMLLASYVVNSLIDREKELTL